MHDTTIMQGTSCASFQVARKARELPPMLATPSILQGFYYCHNKSTTEKIFALYAVSQCPTTYMSDADDDDELETPLQDQRTFGAGLKLKQVKFVSSSTTDHGDIAASSVQARNAEDISNRYLDLVLPSRPDVQHVTPTLLGSKQDVQAMILCEVCNQPVSSKTSTTSHDASLVHQICLPHSHPPSAIDRKRKGLSILAAHGWDPDARLGLGAHGQGRTIPIKTVSKDDKLGIGVVLPKGELEKRLAKKQIEKEAGKKLDAGRVRKAYSEDSKKREALQKLFYGRDDVEKYLQKSEEWE